MLQQLHSYAIFCDDIRQETNGKTMFIGTFRDYMYFNGPGPWMLANFHIHVVFRRPAAHYFAWSRFEIRLASSVGQRVVYQLDNPVFDEPYRANGAQMDWDTEPYKQTRFTVSLAQLVIEGASRLSVYAVINGEDILIDRLRILQTVPPPSPTPPHTGGIADMFAAPVVPPLPPLPRR